MRDDQVAERLYELGLTGDRVPHDRAKNLQAIDRLLIGDPFYTFAIRRVEEARPQLDRATILAMMSQLTGCSAKIDRESGPGYIDPMRSARGIQHYARVIREAATRQMRVVLATGHPGSLIGLYQPVAEFLQHKGCRVLRGAIGEAVAEKDWFLDFVGQVGCVTDTCGLRHSHHADPMEKLLQAVGPVDWAFCDHGLAGATLNARVNTIALMDTNDPALAVALALGEDRLIMAPLSDNAPNAVMEKLAELVLKLAAA